MVIEASRRAMRCVAFMFGSNGGNTAGLVAGSEGEGASRLRFSRALIRKFVGG